MKHYKIFKSLNYSTVSKFVEKKWIDANDWSLGKYSVDENVRLKTALLSSDLCDDSDVYIVVKRRITIEGRDINHWTSKNLPLRIMLHSGHACQKSTTYS